MRVDDLIHCVLLSSDNYGTGALARSNGKLLLGSE